MSRPDWSEYFMQMAHLVATRSTCDRKHVGCVLVRDKRVIATGFNGSVSGGAHCDDVGHDLVTLADGKVNCQRTTHAELNSVLQAARFGIATEGAEVYVNTYPCWGCAKALLSAGIVRVVVDADYNNDPRVEDAFKRKGVALIRYKSVEVP